MKQPSASLSLLAGAILALSATTARAATFAETWAAVQAGPYASKPQHHTRLSDFVVRGVNVLAQAANRTLTSTADTLPSFQKLVHPVGICFAGTWKITETSPYTGYFARGSEAAIIVRASEALGNPEVGDYRSFGFAGKIFAKDGTGETANFFTIDDLGGTADDSFFDSPKTNRPATSFHVSDLLIFPTLAEIAKTFVLVDSNPTVRQVYEVAELGLADPSTARFPGWFMVRADTATRVGAVDFRDELHLFYYPSGLRFGIYVKDSAGAAWVRLGTINLTQEALSSGCDHRLHFHHPPAG